MENITEEDFKKQRDPNSIIKLQCPRCGIDFFIRRWRYKMQMDVNKGRGLFCSHRCSLIARNVSQEHRDKISKAQKGISVLSRGRKGKVIPLEVREKIRQSKLGKPSPQDYMIVHTALEALGVKKAAVTKGLVPDAIFVKDGLLTALEVEKKRIESDIRRKMAQYDNRDDYDKVIIMWYDPKGNYLKQWVKYKGEWNLVTL